jgi:tight adherence protein C
MILIVLAGLGLGIGLAVIVWGLFPPRLTLRAALARLSGEHVTAPTDVLTQGVGGARRICGRLLEVNVRKVPRLAEIVLPDLAITGTPTETFAVKVAGYSIGLALLGPVLWAASGAVGVHLGFTLPALGVLVLGAVGAVTPFLDLHQAAERRRRHFCHSLSTYASLVAMAMAGAMGWSSALEVASTVSSTDWAMEEIAQSLLWAQAYRKQPWEGLERLAVRFNVPDLTDLARSMSQAGDGARIRDSLEAKAHSLRLKETSALEDSAQAVTQKMLLPGVLLMVGYGLLIFYPALASFTGARL